MVMAAACGRMLSGPSKERQASDQGCALRGPVYSRFGLARKFRYATQSSPSREDSALPRPITGPKQKVLGLFVVSALGVGAGITQPQPGLNGLVVIRGCQLALCGWRAVCALCTIVPWRRSEALQRKNADARNGRQRSGVDLGQGSQGMGGQGAKRGLVLA